MLSSLFAEVVSQRPEVSRMVRQTRRFLVCQIDQTLQVANFCYASRSYNVYY